MWCLLQRFTTYRTVLRLQMCCRGLLDGQRGRKEHKWWHLKRNADWDHGEIYKDFLEFFQGRQEWNQWDFEGNSTNRNRASRSKRFRAIDSYQSRSPKGSLQDLQIKMLNVLDSVLFSSSFFDLVLLIDFEWLSSESRYIYIFILIVCVLLRFSDLVRDWLNLDSIEGMMVLTEVFFSFHVFENYWVYGRFVLMIFLFLFSFFLFRRMLFLIYCRKEGFCEGKMFISPFFFSSTS